MRLYEAEILKLLPPWMQEDGANRGLAAGTDAVTRAIAARTRLLTRWDKLDQLTGEELDELAWELNILWYDSTAPIEVRRAVIRSSDLVYAKLGTGFAVNQVIADYYGDGGIEMWFEYGGKPHHFRIHIDGKHISGEDLARFWRILKIVKRRSSWLDEIIITAPAISYQVMICTSCGPSTARTATPMYRAQLPPGKIPISACLGVRSSTVTLPMVVGRPPGRSFARRANDGPMRAYQEEVNH